MASKIIQKKYASVRIALEQRQDRASSRYLRPNLAAKIIYDNAKDRMYRTSATNDGEASPELHGEACSRCCFELGLGRRERGFEDELKETR